MPQPIIQIENIGKAYRLGQTDVKHAMFRDALVGIVKAPFHRLRDLRKAAPEEELFWALRNVSFDVQQGEVVGIIGRNGAGKSTLLKILSRITEPTEGQVTLRGRVASLLEVGTGFHPELTGRENVYLNGAILGMSKAEISRKFDEIVEFAEIEKFLETPVKRYSSGMYVRLAFAVAAHLEPEILIVDEVLAVGDAEFQQKCLGRMGEVTRKGRTVLFVSHNMAAVQSLCPKCILLTKGSITAAGPTNDVAMEYLSSLEHIAALPLHSRHDRSGAGKVRLTDIVASSQTSTASGMLVCGSNVRLTFHLNNVVPSLRIVFALYDLYGHLVADFDSKYVSQDDRAGIGGSALQCVIDELMIVPGRYRINVAILVGNELQDHIESVMFINVQEGAIRGRSIPSGARGTSLMPHYWLFP